MTTPTTASRASFFSPPRAYALPQSSVSCSLSPTPRSKQVPFAKLLIAFMLGALFNVVVFRRTTSSFTTFPSPTPQSASSHVAPVAHPANARFCDAANCIFDLGHNTGQDTAAYLRNASLRVVAVDANPQLMRASAVRFASQVASGRLHLVTAGLAGPNVAQGKTADLTFWVNQNDKFSSFSEPIGCRAPSGGYVAPGDHAYCTPLALPTRTCRDLIRQYGTPVYMKVDIEGLDLTCIRSVAEMPAAQHPFFVSTENVSPVALRVLYDMGYRWFKAVDQASLQRNVSEEALGRSGPWGEHARDFHKGLDWLSSDQLKELMPLPKTAVIDGVQRNVWYDLHAKRR